MVSIEIDSLHLERDALHVEVDARTVKNLISNIYNNNLKFLLITLDCINLLLKFRRFIIENIYEKANAVVDILVGIYANKQTKFIIHVSSPKETCLILFKSITSICEPSVY